MARKLPILRFVWPTILVSTLLFSACTFAAVFLYRWHAMTAQHLTEDISSGTVAAKLDEALRKLGPMVASGSSQVEKTHETIWVLLADADALTNTEDEETLEGELRQSFSDYYELWLEHGNGPRAKNPALQHLEKNTLPLSARWQQVTGTEINQSEQALKETIKWIAWGLVAVGTIGSLAGIILGYGVARALRRSIYQLSVNIRNATDRLRLDLPTVTLRSTNSMEYLHEQMQNLMGEIEQMVQRLQEREHEVRRAEQLAAVGQLAAGVAHELRNPLTAVKMLVQTSREDLEGRGVPVEDLEVIEKEIRRLEASLQSFLDFARPPRMERRRTDLCAVIDEALALISGRARKQRVEWNRDAPAAPIHLEADSGQLRQLLVNLLLNALDAMPGGGRLSVAVRAPDAARVTVAVHDSGPGIAPGIVPRLFEPFVSSKETGLGLGLVVSRRIAEAHDGTLQGQNSPAGGACFTLTLPARAAALYEPRPARLVAAG